MLTLKHIKEEWYKKGRDIKRSGNEIDSLIIYIRGCPSVAEVSIEVPSYIIWLTILFPISCPVEPVPKDPKEVVNSLNQYAEEPLVKTQKTVKRFPVSKYHRFRI